MSDTGWKTLPYLGIMTRPMLGKALHISTRQVRRLELQGLPRLPGPQARYDAAQAHAWIVSRKWKRRYAVPSETPETEERSDQDREAAD